MYCIYNVDRDLLCRWGQRLVLFNERQDAIDFMEKLPAFFEDDNMAIIEANDGIMQYEYEYINSSELSMETLLKENEYIKNLKEKQNNVREGVIQWLEHYRKY